MKKNILLPIIVITLFASCKKESIQSELKKPKENRIPLIKASNIGFGFQEVKKFVRSVPEILGQSQPSELYEAVNKKEGIHKYFLYLNGNTTNEPLIIISKKEIGPQINLSALDLKKQAYYFDDSGKKVSGILRSKKDGKIIELNETLASKEIGPNQICIDWYWVIINEQTGEVVGEIFIETKCYGPGDGEGGGGGDETLDCTNQTETEQDNMLNSIQMTNPGIVIYDNGSPVINRFGNEERPRTPKFVFAQFTGLAFTNLEWTAYFSGVVSRNMIGDDYKWKSITYSSAAQTDGVTLPCVSYNMNVTSTSVTISQDKKEAYASLNYVFTVSLFGGAGPKSKPFAAWASKTFLAND